MKGFVERSKHIWSLLLLLFCIQGKALFVHLEYQTPVCIRAQQFNRFLAVRSEFPDMKGTEAAAPFELVAVSSDHQAVKDGSIIVIFKSASNPAKTGVIEFNQICTIEPVKASVGAWKDKAGFFEKKRLIWTFPGSKWNEKQEKDAPHFQPRVSDDAEPALKTDAVNFAITSPAGKIGPVNLGETINIVSRAAGSSNNRLMWVLNLDQGGVLPVLISSDDPWGRDPKSGLGGDRRIEAGKLSIEMVDSSLLGDEGWRDLARVFQSGKAAPGGKFASGGRQFTYEPAIFGKGNALYADGWKGDKVGTVWVKFRARAKSDIMVYVSTQPKWMDAAGTYCFFFGAYNNTRSQIRKGTQVVMEVDVAKQGDPTSLITGNGSMWDDYWVSVEQTEDGKAVLTAGKGKKVGDLVKMSWTDEAPLKFVQYVGFGGWSNPVEFDAIAQSGNEIGAKIPADFVRVPGMVKALALGLHEGKIFIFGIGEKGGLLSWDSGSIKPNPWNIVTAKDSQGARIMKILDVGAAADGTIALVSSKRRVYTFNRAKNIWEILSNKVVGKKKKAMLDRIAVGNANTIVGLDKKTKNIYLFQDDAWILISEGEGLDIAAGYDGSVFALNTKRELFSWENKAWKRVDTSFKFSMISAASKDDLYGTVFEGKKRKTYVFTKGSWEALQTAEGSDAAGLKDILVLPTKPIFTVVLDEQGNVYRKGDLSAQIDDAIKIGRPVVAVDKKGDKKKSKKSKSKTSVSFAEKVKKAKSMANDLSLKKKKKNSKGSKK